MSALAAAGQASGAEVPASRRPVRERRQATTVRYVYSLAESNWPRPNCADPGSPSPPASRKSRVAVDRVQRVEVNPSDLHDPIDRGTASVAQCTPARACMTSSPPARLMERISGAGTRAPRGRVRPSSSCSLRGRDGHDPGDDRNLDPRKLAARPEVKEVAIVEEEVA